MVSVKSRLILKKKQSIPWLELLAANLLSSSFVCVYENLKAVYNFDKIYWWIDSILVFGWINNVSKIYKQHVQLRLINVKNLVKREIWKLIPFKKNLDDIISRGIKVKEFISSKLWFNGPDFLTLPLNFWPHLSVWDLFTYDISSEEKSVIMKVARV